MNMILKFRPIGVRNYEIEENQCSEYKCIEAYNGFCLNAWKIEKVEVFEHDIVVINGCAGGSTTVRIKDKSYEKFLSETPFFVNKFLDFSHILSLLYQPFEYCAHLFKMTTPTQKLFVNLSIKLFKQK